MMKKFLSTLALIAMLAGCGGGRSTAGPSPTSQGSGSPSASAGQTPSSPAGSGQSTPRATGEPDGHPGEDGTHAGETYSKDRLPPDGFRKADSGESATGSERIQLLVKTDPGCVEVGNYITFTAKTKPDVQVGFLSTVPGDADGRAQEKRGRSGADGLFSWRLQVPKDAPTFQYSLFAAVADDKGQDGGRSGKWFHVVAKPGECP